MATNSPSRNFADSSLPEAATRPDEAVKNVFCLLCSSPNASDALTCVACGTPLSRDEDELSDLEALPTGTPLNDGALIIENVLGRGGFGITYAARDRDGQLVAVKEFFPSGCFRASLQVKTGSGWGAGEFDQLRQSFLTEARTLGRFTHPHIVRVLEVWEENGSALFAMEHLDGETLAQKLDRCGALTEREALEICEGIVEALETLHAANLLHRDIKPPNVMLARDAFLASGNRDWNRVVLLDFGSARTFDANTQKVQTRNMTALVTPGYAPLEQYAERARRGRYTDIYALGATLYHMLTGLAPISALDRAAGSDLPTPEEINPLISHRVSEVVMWALSMNVAERPSSAREWLQALREGRKTSAPVNKKEKEESTPPSTLKPDLVASTQPGLPWLHNPSTKVSANGTQTQTLPRPLDISSDGVWHRVVVEVARVKWPSLCACCGVPCSSTMKVVEKEVAWEVPYCPPCRNHAERGHSLSGGSSGLAISGATIGIIMGPGFEQWPLAIAFGLVVPIIALMNAEAIGWWAFRRQKRLSADCSCFSPAVRFKGRTGNVFSFEFANEEFAREFTQLNTQTPSKPSKQNEDFFEADAQRRKEAVSSRRADKAQVKAKAGRHKVRE